MGGDVTLNSHKGEPGLFFAETDDISLLNGGCFHFIIFQVKIIILIKKDSVICSFYSRQTLVELSLYISDSVPGA